jgi:MFS family permease
MYVTLRGAPAERTSRGGRTGRVAGTVLLLGLVSLLTDVSSESVSSVLPLYLTGALGLGPLAYGFVDGLYQGVSALVRILGGWVSDRVDRPKWVAAAGYGLSALARLLLLPAGGLAGVTAVITTDRLGKGLRTAPRDAMISASTEPAMLGRAYGVHRAMDTTGALIGPLLAFGILLWLPGSYRSVFVVSFVFAVIGLAVLLLLVPDLRPGRAALGPDDAAPVTRSAPSWRLLADPRLSRLLGVAGVLGLLTIGDGFLYLALQRRDQFATEYFPLLYVGTNFAYLALAIPLGRLADRVGRAKVFVGGHVALVVAYVAAGGPFAGVAATVACLLLLGTFYASTDGLLAALAGRLVDLPVRTSGIATAQTVVAAARFASSLGFGLLWVSLGRSQALWVVAVALTAALPLVARTVTRLDADDRSGAASGVAAEVP